MSDERAVDSTEEIARRHGHTGPINCQDCGTTEEVHFGSWFNPETKKSGNFLQCCACGIRAGDHPSDHSSCDSPAATLLPHWGGDDLGQAAYAGILDRAIQAYTQGREEALRRWELEDEGIHQHALAAVLVNVGTAYAAAALFQAARLVGDEGSAVTLEELATSLDLRIVESLEKVVTDVTSSREPRAFRQETGWILNVPGEEDGPQRCSSNHFREQDGRPACTSTAVWKIVTFFNDGFGMTLSFYCEADLPEEHHALAAAWIGG